MTMNIRKQILSMILDRYDIYEITVKTGLSLQNIENLFSGIFFNRIPIKVRTENLTFNLGTFKNGIFKKKCK